MSTDTTAPSPMGRTLTIHGVSKRFGETQANDGISFEVRGGSIHGIVGQNGAGKSTLMKVVFGLERADEGEVLLDGKRLNVTSPRDALASGIGLVAQELALIDQMSALENLMLGHEPVKWPFLDRASALAEAQRVEASLGLQLPWDERVSELSIAQKQQIEVLRLLLLGADVLIFDEPTAALAPAQINAFLDLLRHLQAEGRTIIFISHKLREILAICESITVLRGGRHINTVAAHDVDVQAISTMMIGEQLQTSTIEHHPMGEPVLTVSGLSYRDDRRISRLADVSHEFRSRGITGVCGVTGNGQEEFIELLAGLMRPAAGTIRLQDVDITREDVRGRRDAGIAYVPADRKGEGLAPAGSVLENAIAGFQRQLARRGWLSSESVTDHTSQLLDTFDVVHSSVEAPVSSLSGGNQQKLMIGREMMHEPQVLLAAQPTRGVDVGGIRNIHGMLQQERDRGAAVILSSEDLDELMDLSDEIIVFFSGRLAATFSRPFDRQLIGNAMVGATSDAH